MKNKKILTDYEREFVSSNKKREQYQKSVQRQYFYRIRQKAIRMMQDLEFLATHMPEDQQSQVFTDQLFLPVVKAVLNPKRVDIRFFLLKDIKNYRYQNIYVINKRVFGLCNKLIEIAALSGDKLIPPDIGNLFAIGPSYQEQINTVRRVGELVK